MADPVAARAAGADTEIHECYECGEVFFTGRALNGHYADCCPDATDDGGEGA